MSIEVIKELEVKILEYKKRLNEMWNNDESDVVDMLYLSEEVITLQNRLIRRLKHKIKK